MKAAAVFETPKWGRMATATALTGVPEGVLRHLVASGDVRAKKLGGKRNCATVYCVPDIVEWIEQQPDARDTWNRGC
jgi:hypothetical protein